MEKMVSELFSAYLEQSTATDPDLSKLALQKEKELRNQLNEEQTKCFEELFEITAQIHYLEVKDAFFYACKAGATLSKELTT